MTHSESTGPTFANTVTWWIGAEGRSTIAQGERILKLRNQRSGVAGGRKLSWLWLFFGANVRSTAGQGLSWKRWGTYWRRKVAGMSLGVSRKALRWQNGSEFAVTNAVTPTDNALS